MGCGLMASRVWEGFGRGLAHGPWYGDLLVSLGRVCLFATLVVSETTINLEVFVHFKQMFEKRYTRAE